MFQPQGLPLTTLKVDEVIAPIVYTLPLLSYHVAIIKGTDVDQPRNLAKSVTVEQYNLLITLGNYIDY